MNSDGDCYQAAGRFVMDNNHSYPDLILCHGEVTGQGQLSGTKYGHAWVEDGETVIDKSNGRDIQMSKPVYYFLGKIGNNVHYYTWEEARTKILDSGTWGPWDLQTESGL